MLNSTHHLILEEIGRLEAEREVINRKINQLRCSLPMPQPKPVVGGEAIDTPVKTLLAEPVRLPPQIADHAIIRFLERRYNFEFEGLRRELLTDTIKLAIEMGARSVKAHGGRFMIRGNKATTFIVDDRRRR